MVSATDSLRLRNSGPLIAFSAALLMEPSRAYLIWLMFKKIFLRWLFCRRTKKERQKHTPKRRGVSLTFSFATNNLNYAVMCNVVVWFCGLFNVGKFKNQSKQVKSKHLNLIKMWFCGYEWCDIVFLWFIQNFPCDRPSRRLHIEYHIMRKSSIFSRIFYILFTIWP